MNITMKNNTLQNQKDHDEHHNSPRKLSHKINRDEHHHLKNKFYKSQ